jgi:signal transduction histidine kinase
VAVAVKGTTVGWLQTPVDTFSESRREAAFLERVNGILLVAAVGAAVLALIAGAVLARSLTRPLRDLTDATQAIAAGDFNRRVAVRSRDELGTLAESFNRMSAALAEAQRVRRQMTADIAHELRTPLAIILGHLDAVGDGVLADSSQAMIVIREETERLARLVEDLRTLTRADSGELRLEPRPSDLGALLRQAATARRPASRAKRITLQVEAPEAMAPVVLDPDRIAQVIGNLLTNALFHTPDGGRIEVGCLEQGRSVRVWVRDSGPGIESDELPRVFDRFYRTDKSRRREDGGSGLGLAIARSIVEAHAGRIWAESLAGFGASILFELPRVPASDA